MSFQSLSWLVYTVTAARKTEGSLFSWCANVASLLTIARCSANERRGKKKDIRWYVARKGSFAWEMLQRRLIFLGFAALAIRCDSKLLSMLMIIIKRLLACRVDHRGRRQWHEIGRNHFCCTPHARSSRPVEHY
jgi:hypothetical protein